MILNPSAEDLHTWAYDPTSEPPNQDWELVLSWSMERGLLGRCIAFAADPDCPKSEFFLLVLYQWLETAARNDSFEVNRMSYDDWLDVARGVRAPAVKRWRHEARLIFQGVVPFDREKWYHGLYGAGTEIDDHSEPD